MNIRNKAGRKTLGYQLRRQGYRIVRGSEMRLNECNDNFLIQDGLYVVRSRPCSCLTGNYGPIAGRVLDYDETDRGNVIRVLDTSERGRFVRAVSKCSVNGARIILQK